VVSFAGMGRCWTASRINAEEKSFVSSEVKPPLDTSEDSARVTIAEQPRFPWPAAALTILGLSIAGWLGLALIIGWLLP